MSEHESTAPDGTESTTDYSLTDPASLADSDDVDYQEHAFVHESEDHCERAYVGRAIVGVTDDDGRLLLRIHEESGAGVLPNGKVEEGGDWAAEAVRGVREQTGLDVELDGPERMRLAEHRVEGEETPFEATTHVVFRASPAAVAAEPHTDVDGVSVEWRDAVPDANGDGPADDDLRLFVD